MSEAEMIAAARACRQRLMNPSNAKLDYGIDLRRKEPPPPAVVLEEPEPEPPSPANVIDFDLERLCRLGEQLVALGEKLSTVADDNLPHLSIREIQKAVCRYYQCSLVDLLSQRRTREFVYVRHIAMYLCKTLTLRSLPEIGRKTGGRDHTTVIHGVRRIAGLLLTDHRLRDEIQIITMGLMEKFTPGRPSLNVKRGRA